MIDPVRISSIHSVIVRDCNLHEEADALARGTDNAHPHALRELRQILLKKCLTFLRDFNVDVGNRSEPSIVRRRGRTGSETVQTDRQT